MNFIFISEKYISDLKNNILNSNDVFYHELRYEINEMAREFYNQGPWTITDYIGKRSAGKKNDYYSEAPYFWPDPKDPSKPYIRKDGQVNPDRFTIHKNTFAYMSHALLALSSAGYLLDNKAYLEKAAEIARVWYIDPETKMNPNVQYGEAIINQCSGRKRGIIACTSMDLSIHAFCYLDASNMFQSLISDLKKWVREMMIWLTTSDLGIEESFSDNNHGTWWNTHVASAAAFIGDEIQFDKCITYFKENIVSKQISTDGKFTKDLERTRSLHYTLFNLDAATLFCELAYQKGIDLWHFQSEDGRSLKKAISYLITGIDDPYSWKHKQIVGDIPMDEMCIQYAALRLNMPEAAALNKKKSEGCYMIKTQSPLGPVALLEGYNHLA